MPVQIAAVSPAVSPAMSPATSAPPLRSRSPEPRRPDAERRETQRQLRRAEFWQSLMSNDRG